MITLLFCLMSCLALAPWDHAATPRTTVTRAIDALGGRAAIEVMSSLRIESIGHDYFIDQSERPEGPFIVRYLSTKETRDVAGGRSRVDEQQRFVLAPDWTAPGTTIVDREAAAAVRGDRLVPAPRETFDEGRERLELAPERMLLAALDAPDLTMETDVVLHGIPQRVVSFGWRNRRVRLLVDSHDDVPSAMEVMAEDSMGIWGKVRRVTYFSLWTLLPGGVRYPLQLDHEWNDVQKSSETITTIGVNEPVDASRLEIPASVKAAFAALPAVGGVGALTFDPSRANELSANVTQFSGSWNVAFVRQPDGLVVIEAPIGSSYSAAVLGEAERRYPGVHVKAVITTSDAWPHLGGVREYAARGVPIYACDLNRPILERLLKADYSAHPDTLAKAPRPAKFTWVTDKTIIGSGDTRVEVYPAHGENGERMLFVYLPGSRLLYSSDDIQHDRTGAFFMPEYLFEVREAVRKYGLAVDRIFGMHIGPTSWNEIEGAISAASSSAGAQRGR